MILLPCTSTILFLYNQFQVWVWLENHFKSGNNNRTTTSWFKLFQHFQFGSRLQAILLAATARERGAVVMMVLMNVGIWLMVSFDHTRIRITMHSEMRGTKGFFLPALAELNRCEHFECIKLSYLNQ